MRHPIYVHLGLLGLLGLLLATACTRRDFSCADEPEHRFCRDNPDAGRDAAPPDATPIDAPPEDAPMADAGADGGPCGPCADPTPLCRETDGECVECLGDENCGDERCDLEPGQCVECLANLDCEDPTEARCDDSTFTCEPCMNDTHCMGLGDLGVCDGGQCVECTSSDRSACGLNVCDGATNTCTDRPAGAKGLCQDCVADAECMAGQLCVAMTFESTEVGRFCLWREDASEGPGGSCTNVRPYRQGEETTSVDEVTARVCSLRQTTCVALNQFDMRSCTVGAPPPAATDDECGVAALDDGLCRMVDALTNRCTIPCLSDDDCLSGSTCNTAATPRYCNF